MSRARKPGNRWRLVHRHAASYADADAHAYTDAHTPPDAHAIPNADPHRDRHRISDTDRHGRPEPYRHLGPNCDRDVVLIPICIVVDRIDPHASCATPSNPTSVHRWARTE